MAGESLSRDRSKFESRMTRDSEVIYKDVGRPFWDAEGKRIWAFVQAEEAEYEYNLDRYLSDF